MKNTFYTISIILIFISFSCQTNSESEVTTKKIEGVIGEKAMIVTAHPLASEVGREIIKKGGNAVDAAVAVQFTLAVVFPFAGNIGGGGFMVYRDSAGNSNTLDFREMAPAGASRDMYLDEEKNVIENLSTRGHLASGVPGSVDGMVEAHRKYGTLPWKALVQPAIDLAKKGFSLTKKAAHGFNKVQESLLENNTVEPLQFLSEWKEGDSIIQLDLASSLVRIRDNGRAGFYEGKTAKLIVEEMERGNGIITYKDLENYKSIWRTPIIGTYRGKKIIGMPPPSSGGIAVLQLLQSVEDFDLKKMGHNSAEYLHLLTEAERRVFADRAEYLGDIDFYDVPVEELTNPNYNKKRMGSFNPLKATSSDSIGHGKVFIESDNTTHFSIVDTQGNAVAITTTINGSFGSRVVVGSGGFFLNNEMDDFSMAPGIPNMFGLLGGEANAIVPGKRMLSAMSPTIVEENNELFMILGSPGGSTIITSVFQTLLNVIDFDMSMLEAVTTKRVHSQWKPDVIMYEKEALPEDVIKDLGELGHTLIDRDKIGRVDAIKILKNKKIEGGADPRGDDSAAGF